MIDEITKEISLAGLAVIVIACVALTKIVRKIVETSIPAWRKKADENHPDKTYATNMSRWWNQVILYVIPVTIGLLLGFIKSEFIFGKIDTLSGKMFYGASVGWMSGFLVKIFFQLIKEKTGVDVSKVADMDPNPMASVSKDADSTSDDQDKEEA
jgi:Na+/H+ antiporter NhaA